MSQVAAARKYFAPHPSGETVLQRSMAIMEESRRNGTHSDTVRAVCDQCREWCGGIYYIGPTGTRFCGACADKFGQGPIADAKRLRGNK